jgi:fused signal recognition particle receptor
VEIVVQPSGKKLQSLSLLSGGEKAMTAVALILSLFLIRPTPFCLLDEVDAPLDEANIGRFNQLVRDMATASQFVLITHNRRTMEAADTLYGITMEQAGISKVVSVSSAKPRSVRGRRWSPCGPSPWRPSSWSWRGCSRGDCSVAPARDRGAEAAPARATRARDARAGAREDARALRGEPRRRLLARRRGTDAALAELEEVLVSADVGAQVSGELVQGLRPRVGKDATPGTLREALRDELETLLAGPAAPVPTAKPWVVLVAGVNGVGKTTTIGRLAAMHREAGRRVMLVAADTFRGRGAEQLAVWAERTGSEIVRQAAGADPSAVVFDGMKAGRRPRDRRGARRHGWTSPHAHEPHGGTAQDPAHHRAPGARRSARDAPHRRRDDGQNAVSQARVFTEALGITGLVLTKLDGTARGGVAIAVRRELSAPITWIGVGEGVDDLRAFDAKQFAAALLAPPDSRDAHGARSP